MKILVYGAGVIGCIYSAKLFNAGADITLLARGERYVQLKQNGIIINDVLNGKQIQCKVPLTEDLGHSDFYDLIIVTVQLDQLDGVKMKLKQNTASAFQNGQINYVQIKEQKTTIGDLDGTITPMTKDI